MNRADELVARFMLQNFRESFPHSGHMKRKYGEDSQHLGQCDSARVSEVDARDGFYGCDTGCEYLSIDATITCDHDRKIEYDYGDFGALEWVIEAMEKLDKS